MDPKQFKRETEEHAKAKAEYRKEMISRDQAIHGENSRIKYDPKTGSLKEE